ncbi:hypothetical protein [Paucidesulfovibrio longus]|uniref:hypothetical protein n=1 Tax=Paucidesulfovibrio longus TaxID=889 RepID=UPI0003B47A81|nr:hypothetical protein [Paucidesulfovibrio longus]
MPAENDPKTAAHGAESRDIRRTLLRHYLLLVGPAAVVAALWAGLKALALVNPVQGVSAAVAGPALFILAAVLALAAPIPLRARFVNRVAGKRSVDPEAFLEFEKLLLSVSLPSVWAAVAAYVLEANLFHVAGSLLAALYAAYYYYPSPQRVAHEMRLFRVGRYGSAADGAEQGRAA